MQTDQEVLKSAQVLDFDRSDVHVFLHRKAFLGRCL
jgi:hypothetical protein